MLKAIFKHFNKNTHFLFFFTKQSNVYLSYGNRTIFMSVRGRTEELYA